MPKKEDQQQPEQRQVDMGQAGHLEQQAMTVRHGCFFLAYSISVASVSAFFSSVALATWPAPWILPSA
jgi:hypothetical protein